MSVAQGVFHVTAIIHLVPFGIDEYVRQMHGGGHVDILLHDLEVFGTMVMCPVYPRHHAGVYPRIVGEGGGWGNICNQSRLHHIGERAYYHDSPRAHPWSAYEAVVFVRHYAVQIGSLCVVKTSGTIVVVYVGLGQQCPHAAMWVGQHGESPPSVVVLTPSVSCLWIEFLITVGPLHHPPWRALGQVEGCLLATHGSVVHVCGVPESQSIVVESHNERNTQSLTRTLP